MKTLILVRTLAEFKMLHWTDCPRYNRVRSIDGLYDEALNRQVPEAILRSSRRIHNRK